MKIEGNPKRVIAIGDIHGCAAALSALIEAILPVKDDLVIPLGDLVDRGPSSSTVIQMLLEIGQECQLRPILGNHEEMMLQAMNDPKMLEMWLRCGGASTLESYGFSGDLAVVEPSHLDFLSAFSDYLEVEDFFFVHANYDPGLPFAEQPADLLRWTSLDQELPSAHTSGKHAIVGHTPERSGEIFSLPHLTCIDTYCYGGGWLTAMEVLSGQIWQASAEGSLREI
ncbi:MAG: metallophosphoesterase family protein [Lacipirellulaceae bacterium]